MSTTNTTKKTPERVDEILGTMAAVGTGGALLAGLGKLFWGNTKNTPEQLAQLRAMITSIRKYLVQVRAAYAKNPMFGDISTRLDAFNKQTEAAFASNNPKQVQRAVLQAGSVAAYVTKFALIQEDLESLMDSHLEEMNSEDRSQQEKVFKMMYNIIFRELSAVNMNKLGGFFKRLTQLGMNFIPAPPGLTPKDLANSYVEALKKALYTNADDAQPAAGQQPAAEPDSTPALSPAGLVAEASRALYNEIQLARLSSLKEYKLAFQQSLLGEQVNRKPAIDKFLAASKQVVDGVAQASRTAASTTTQTAASTTTQPAQVPVQLTPDQFKRVQTILQNVTSVMGRLTPEQKKQFSGLLGQLKSAIG
jgi:hypothetical protein